MVVRSAPSPSALSESDVSRPPANASRLGEKLEFGEARQG